MADIVKTVKNEMTFEKILAAAMHTPGVKINREKFLRKELIRYCSEDIITEAIKNNPAKAGISKELVNKISKQVINYEATKVTTLSVAASIQAEQRQSELQQQILHHTLHSFLGQCRN